MDFLTIKYVEDWTATEGNPIHRCEVVDKDGRTLGQLPITSVKFEGTPSSVGVVSFSIVAEWAVLKGHT